MSPKMKKAPEKQKQNLTLSLDRETIRKARVLAAKRSTSISALLTLHIESLFGKEDAYADAKRQALALLDKGLDLGGEIRAGRDELHQR